MLIIIYIFNPISSQILTTLSSNVRDVSTLAECDNCPSGETSIH